MEETKVKSFFQFVTVEPTVFLYTFACAITVVSEKDFVFEKACLVSHNLTEEICNNLSINDKWKNDVQV